MNTSTVWPLASMMLALLGLAAPAAAQLAEEPIAGVESTIGIVIVDSASVDDALVVELGLRLPGRRIEASGRLVDVPVDRFAWIGVTPLRAGALLEVVLSDGRAYSRVVDVADAQLDRALAGALANMLDAIEHGRLAPEHTGVEIPIAPVAATAPPEPPPEPTPVRVDPPRRSPAAPAVQWWLGPRVSAGVSFGVGPPVAEGGLVAGGASVGLDALHRGGGLVAVDLRIAGIRLGTLQLVRVRVAVGGGYVVRRGRFFLPLRAALSVEPVVGTGARLGKAGGGEASPAPLVGALLHAGPGVVWWLRSERAAVRAFVDLELAASMEARAQPGVPRYVGAGAAGRGLGRSGGLELGAGVGVGGWFAIRGRSP